MKNLIPLILFALLVASTTRGQVVNKDPMTTLKCAKSPVYSVAISPKGNVIAIGLGEYAELWDLEKGKKMFTLKHETPGGVKTVNYISFNPIGEYVCTVDFKGKRKVWSVKNGKEDKYLKGHNEWMPKPEMIRNKLGFKMTNSDFNNYYVMLEAAHPLDKNIVAKSTKKSSVEFHNTGDSSIEQELTFPDTKDRTHLFPVYFNEQGDIFITGSDQGEVYLYKVASRSRY